jgi:hypothetical protein
VGEVTGARLIEACVTLADTLEEDAGTGSSSRVSGLLVDWCVELVGVAAAGLLLTDERGEPRVAAASAEPARLLALTEQQCGQGPGLQCFRDGAEVTAADLRRDGAGWPAFAVAALRSGYTAAFAVPMRRQGEVIGAVTLLRGTPGPLTPTETALARSLADAATVGILQRRARHRHELLATQLQSALESRILVEQAKGVLAERWSMDVDEAFVILRGQARTRRVRLTELARAVLDHTVELAPR